MMKLPASSRLYVKISSRELVEFSGFTSDLFSNLLFTRAIIGYDVFVFRVLRSTSPETFSFRVI
jgi:hypothetical protein